MNRTILIVLLLLLLLPIACATNKSKVATMLGYKKSTVVQAGPYQLHYAKDGTDEFVLLAKGDHENTFSKYTGEGTDVSIKGLSTIHFEQNPDGSPTNLSLNLCDADGNSTVSFIDKNVDGQWDIKIGYKPTKVWIWYDGQWMDRSSNTNRVWMWKDGQWIEHPSREESTNGPGSISH